MKRFGKCLTVVGLLLMSAAMSLFVYNMYTQIHSERMTSEIISQLELQNDDDNVNGTEEREASKGETEEETANGIDEEGVSAVREGEMPSVEIDGNSIIGTIAIPAVLSNVLPIFRDCTTENLYIGPCRYEGSVYDDNLIIAGHSYITVFRPIRNLVPGDYVMITDINNQVFEYIVESKEELNDYAVEEMISGDWDLTLFTCTASGDARAAVRCRKTA